MLTSKELLERTGISRATLNNYIARGLLPKPVVSRPTIRGKGPRQIGYFPDETVLRIQKIQQFKREGLGLDDIAARLLVEEAKPERASTGADEPRTTTQGGATRKQSLVVTVDQIAHPAYMVNYKFEVVWFNDAARDALGAALAQLAPRTAERSIFRLLLLADDDRLVANREELLRLNLALAKERMGLDAITQPLQPIAAVKAHLLEQLYAETTALAPGPIVEFPLRLKGRKGGAEPHSAYAAYFREGILVVLSPLREDTNALLQLLSRRDVVIRNLLSKRLPTLTDLAVLVADLQDSVKICSELPPEEYFELINQIWSAAGTVFRKYYGTHGKHVGDGMVYYFFPQPDCNYIMNAAVCAHELKSVMARIS